MFPYAFVGQGLALAENQPKWQIETAAGASPCPTIFILIICKTAICRGRCPHRPVREQQLCLLYFVKKKSAKFTEISIKHLQNIKKCVSIILPLNNNEKLKIDIELITLTQERVFYGKTT